MSTKPIPPKGETPQHGLHKVIERRKGVLSPLDIARLERAIVALDDVRQAVADYRYSEGCTCCRDVDAHDAHTKRLAELLGVQPYADGSGYDFAPYRTGQPT